MPPKREKKPQDAGERERRIASAISAVKNSRISSIPKAARLYQVSTTTLRRRLKGPAPHDRKGIQHRKLHQDEENWLAQAVISLIEQGAAPSLDQVREMANSLPAKRHTQPTPGVTPEWVFCFINRREELRKVYSTLMPQRDDHQRDESGDLSTASEWFDKVKSTIMQHEIANEDIWHFDETGYTIGPLASAQVATKSEMIEEASPPQPDNRRWATSIECINTTGVTLPPMIVFKGRYHLECWYQVEELPDDWCIAVSPGGWATDETRLAWLKTVFVPATSHTVGRFRLLLLGQSSYLTPQFGQMCKDNNIIPICPPPNSRIGLPLEAGCLSSLEDAYRRQAEDFMRRDWRYIDKLDFLASLPELRRRVFTAENIKSGFSAAGIVPLCREKVLLRPKTRIRDRTPLTIRSNAANAIESLRKLDWMGEELALLKADVKAMDLSLSTRAAVNRVFRFVENTERQRLAVLKEYDELKASREEDEEQMRAEEEAEEAQE